MHDALVSGDADYRQKQKKGHIPLKSATLSGGNGGNFVKFYRFWLSSIFTIIIIVVIIAIIIIIIITWWRKVAGIGDLLDCLLPDQRTLGIDDHDDDLSLF